ncbi:MAG: hypothetical protein MMC23_002038 [Stictis urceolatum]|nr:hypothetical protein [Stictis urceolata]
MALVADSRPSLSDTYTAIPKGTYALKRDFNASTRLTAQHYLWKDALNYCIHPSIPTDSEGIRIADVATGNGIWLFDIAHGLPGGAKLDGFDVSLDQCPPGPWLPKNIHLHTWNIFEELPAEFVGVFDIVHIRLITVAVKENDPLPMIANLHQMLKPGGYLQWDEADSVDWTVRSVHESTATDAVQRLFSQLCGSHDWKRCMVETLNDNGFQDSFLHRVEYDVTMARFWSDVYMSTWDEFARMVLRKPDESDKLSSEAMDQVREGSSISCPKLVWVARKAGDE